MDDTDQNKLFVGGITRETTSQILNEHFNKYGAVLGSVVAMDRFSNQPRGFAFVTFAEPSAVDRALQDSHRILSRNVEVKRALRRGKQQIHQPTGELTLSEGRTTGRAHTGLRTKKIFVGGLPGNLTEDEFRSYFEKFGRITDVVVMRDSMTHRPRGFGFITFDSEDSVDTVMEKNFHELAGKLVEVKRAVPKDGSNPSSSGKGSNFSSSYYQDNFTPYNNSRFCYFPCGYESVAGYPNEAGLFCGVGYGLTPFGQSSPWSPIGVRGSFLTYVSGVPPFYPAYVNGSPGVMGLDGNGYSVILATGSAPSVGTNTVDTNSFGSGGGVGAEASRLG